jgi:ATP/maltotriose-dependent transcriptional regulator MalT
VDALLEREGELAALDAALHDAAGGRGSVVLVPGEAGIGKSTLVRAWLDDPGHDARLLVGFCDDFLTSRTLGPLHDVARTVGGALADAVAAADTTAVLEELLAALSHPLQPTVLVLEDLHWADEATLDVVRYVGRRIDRLPAVLVVTFRDDEVGPEHPLTGVLGVIPSRHVRRVTPHPLSRRAVATLVAGTELDADGVLASTGGNPFFVTELAQTDSALPASVSDAVLARLGALPRGVRDAVELLSVLPRPLPIGELEVLLPDPTVVATAEEHGLLVVRDGAVAFRHELARQAVQESLPASTRTRYHSTVLAHLTRDGADPDAAAVLHHAVGAGRVDVIVAYGPEAAYEAYRAGSHRQALGHQERVLRHAELLHPETHARLLEEHAWSRYNLHQLDVAADVAAELLALRERQGDAEESIRAMILCSRMVYIAGRSAEATAALARAEASIGAATSPRTRAEVAVQHISLAHLLDRLDEAIVLADASADLFAQVGDVSLQVHARHYSSASRVLLGDEGGLDGMWGALELGLAAGIDEPVARVYTNLVEMLLILRRWDELRRVAETAIAFYDDHDMPAHRYNTRGQLARLELFQGRWDDADAQLRRLVASTDAPGVLGGVSAQAFALLAIRRGDDDADERLAEAWELAVHSESAQYMAPTAGAAIERAWLAGTPDDAEEYLAAAAPGLDRTLFGATLAWRSSLVGHRADPETVVSEPERTSLAGDHTAAAAGWGALGMPYEQGLELMLAGDEVSVRSALELFDDLGAAPAARLARARLKELGVRAIPRGPKPATREHPVGLTARQAEVLELVAEGLTNAEIADRLVVSVRTVDHHVSAVLQKLGVESRQEAAERAARLRTVD